MIKDIITDKEFLNQKSIEELAIITEDSMKVIKDLIDTANEHKEECVGLAANQIGYLKRVFVIKVDDKFIPIINPKVIVRCGGIKSADEGCLSRPNEKPIKKRRHKEITIRYYNIDGEDVTEKFKGFTARIIQHEWDHLEGRLI